VGRGHVPVNALGPAVRRIETWSLIDLANQGAPGIEVIFLDTEAHSQTREFVEEMRARYTPEPHR